MRPYRFIQTVLVILSCYALLEGFSGFSNAQSSFHQIYATVWLAVFAISIGSVGIMNAVSYRPVDEGKKSPLDNE